ncbi:MAG: thiamine pyrophosphate-dependent enzyme, partial [Dehalococcoidia bacterium]|nr:thiamine pyrophosphate-dependent enzyme [Dehalococcoidia bacterium]
MDRSEILKILAEFRTDEVVITTMSPSREWPRLSPSALNLGVAGAMGYASSIALGLAIACPNKRIMVLDGDGSLLMNLGTLVTISSRSPSNLVHFVFGNGIYEIPGWIPVPGFDKISICGFARAAGLTKVYDIDNLQDLREHMPTFLHEPGPLLVVLKVDPGPKAPWSTASAYGQ